MNPPAHGPRAVLTSEMIEFCRAIPASCQIEWVKNPVFLHHFEAERMELMRQALLDSGISREGRWQALDFGYLHGLVPEFLHRFFPHSTFTVLDHPQSPNFQNPDYLNLIRTRAYLHLEPGRLEEAGGRGGAYEVIILGEIIEHLDPTVVAKVFADLRPLLAPGGRLLITTPNAGSIRDTILTLLGHDTQSPPIPEGTMGQPHIHLWSHPVLKLTLEHHGWENDRVYYYDGQNTIGYLETNRRWGSWKQQLLGKLFHFGAKFHPRWRGYMVSTWKLKRARG